MKKTITLIMALVSIPMFATNYYVSGSGSDSNNGLTTSTAFETLQYASDLTLPGDTVFIMNGTYTNTYYASNVLDINNSGTAGNGIVYVNYAGHTPVIQLRGNNWAGITIEGVDYITIDGITVIGNNDSITLAYAFSQKDSLNNPSTSGNGIGMTKAYTDSTNKPHHNTIRNCTISKCGGGGIFTYNADYITIENNVVSECAWYSPYGNSGISLYQNWNSDSSRVIKNYVVGNTCYRNEEYIPWFVAGVITDGNGIIIDDGRNTQNGSALGVYVGKTYVANNLVFDNGARGIHCYSSDNVIIVNNTCYYNCQSPFTTEGEFTAYDADSISFINNIAFPKAGIPPIDNGATHIYVDHNLWAANSSLANPFGSNTLTSAPDFLLASTNPSIANFRLQLSSTAINTGTHFYAPLFDRDGNARIVTDSVDRGCYEFQSLAGIANVNAKENGISVFPNPASNQLTLQWNTNQTNLLLVHIYNSIAQEVETMNVFFNNGFAVLDVSDLTAGIYFLNVTSTILNSSPVRFVKVE
jgi:parallel beta-helix repeat protein